MSAISSKYHVKIGDIGFLLARQPRVERHIYSREEAPAFVNKFSSGEPNYRDSTFFPHWVQLNWLNGFNQEFFDDGGKFFRSSGIDPTESLQITLQKGFNSIGQTLSGSIVTAMESIRFSSNSADSYTKLLLNFDGGDASTTFTDTSPGRKTVTPYGNAQIDTAQSKFGGASGLFDGTGDYLTVPDSDDWYFTGDFTIDFWARFASTAGAVQSFCSQGYTGNSYFHCWLETSNTIKFGFLLAGTWEVLYNFAWTPSINTWYHLAIVRSGNTWYFFINGTARSLTLENGSASAVISDKVGTFNVAASPTLATPFNGWMDEFRVSKGIARWTSNFSAPSATYATPTVAYGFQNIVGTSTGKIYLWNDISAYTELFDTRRIEWFESGTDANLVVGDTGGTETAQAQSFQLDAACSIQGVQVYLKKAAGTPGNITCTIETNSTDKPSGTLVNENATATITAFTTTDYGWITVEFPVSFALDATTTYWIVLKTAAAANDQNYTWAADSSSPGYSAGTSAVSTNGGSTWAAVTGTDNYFRVLGNATSVNYIHNSNFSGSEKLYFATGNQAGIVNGDARLYSYDGTTFVLVKIFNTTNESSINCIAEYGSITTKAYIGLGHKAKVYSTTDWSTFTLEKTITVPSNPGWVFTMIEYNKKLYVGGGFPEQLPGTSYQFGGFLYSYDEYSWENVGHFQHTVVTALEVYDNLMFIGTIKKRLYVYNTASIDKLFEFPWNLKISMMKKWDDKLAIATCPTPGNSVTGGEGIYLFDRNGFHNAFAVTDRSWYSICVFKNNLLAGNDDGYIYQTSFTTYQATGYLQTSYDEAQLPSIYKVRKNVVLLHDPLPTGCTITLTYKTDESDASWTSLTSTDSIVGSKISTFEFPSGIYNYKISFKITLATTVSTATPKIKKIIMKYVLSPEFKYLWKMKLLCVDKIVWLDGTEPVGLVGTAIVAGDATITFNSSDKAIPTEGFPNPAGSTMYASVINPDTGAVDSFTYTGKTDTTLTGIPTTGSYALGAHAVGHIVRVRGTDLHLAILAMKQTRTFYTFTDIDGLTYTVLFHSYQADNWVVNQNDYYGGLENEVPITLLQT